MRKAVLTADFIDSSKMELPAMEAAIAQAGDFLSTLQQEGVVETYEFYRGDSFQLVVAHDEDALQIAMRLKSYLNGVQLQEMERVRKRVKPAVDIRAAIGYGAYQAATSLVKNQSEAFRYSGRCLDFIEEEGLSIGFSDGQSPVEQELKVSLLLWHTIIANWTLAQAQVFEKKIQGMPEREIAHQLNISQSAVNQSAKKAGWQAYEVLNQRFQHLIKSEKHL